MIHSIAPHAGDDVIAEWAAEDFDFEEDEDELHAHLNPPRRRVRHMHEVSGNAQDHDI